MQTVKFYTLGCKVNQYDTQNIRERLIEAGFKELEDSEPADVCVINTCTVTHKADADSLNIIRKAKRENPKTKTIVTGCFTEFNEDKIKKIEGINLVIRNKDKDKISEYLLRHNENNVFNGMSELNENKGISYFKGHTRAFLKIQDGCNNFCSYCKVPLVRGASRSRAITDVVQEAHTLVKNGYKEIVLCGICLGAYGGDLNPENNLLLVLDELEKISGLIFIRLSSIEYKDITPDLINKMASSQKLCPHLHVPLQSGDDEILKKMNRDYSARDYRNMIFEIRKIIPYMAITTDVLVGFPAESEENFQNTLRLLREIRPLKVHVFPYSQREGTLAAIKFNQGLSSKIINQRVSWVKDIARHCSYEYKKQFLNTAMDVLMERRWKENSDFWLGRTDNYMEVLVKSNLELQNKFVKLILRDVDGDYLLAEFC